MAPLQDSPDQRLAARLVDEGVRDFIRARHARVSGFVDRTYSLSASLQIHKKALGRDLLRAPANVLLVLPAVLAHLLALMLRLLGWPNAAQWLRRRQWFLATDVGREIEWRLFTELLELPLVQRRRESLNDALSKAIATRLEQAIEAGAVDQVDPELIDSAELRHRLDSAVSAYTDTRAAAAEITNAVMMTGAGIVSFSKLTPGALSFGPAVAAVVAQQLAIASFPLGTTLGAWWYGVFPAEPSLTVVLATTLATVAMLACIAAFAGVIADPLQRRLGLHARRLHKLIEHLERAALGRDSEFAPRDYYLSRVIDVLEIVRLAARGAH